MPTRNSGTRSAVSGLAALALALAGIVITAAPASAAPLTVDNTNDSGPGSLRQAIADANDDAGADTITIAVSGTLTLGSLLPGIIHDLTIVTNGENFIIDAVAVANGLVIDGTGHTNLAVGITGITVENARGNGIDADLDPGSLLTLTGVTVRDSVGSGIAVSTHDADAEIRDSLVVGNGGHDDSGISASLQGGTFVVSDSELDGNSADTGGGIKVRGNDAAVTLSGLHIHDGSASGGGGGIAIDDFSSPTPLVIEDCLIENNTTHGDGGGILIEAVGRPGSSGRIQIFRTTIRGNSAKDTGGGVATYGLGETGNPLVPTVLIQDSTVTGNTTTDVSEPGGGGIAILDDNDYRDAYSVAVVNSTVSGNSSPVGASGMLVTIEPNVPHVPVDVSVRNSTITGNASSSNTPLPAVYVEGDADFTVGNSIIAGNTGTDLLSGDTNDDILAVGIHHSLVGTTTGAKATAALAAGAGNLIGLDPKLGPLADNGGPTPTHLLLAGSPGIDTGDPAFTGLATDQRGLTRVVGVLDMGAVEIQAETSDEPALAATGADAVAPLTGGALLLGAGGLLLLARRRRLAR